MIHGKNLNVLAETNSYFGNNSNNYPDRSNAYFYVEHIRTANETSFIQNVVKWSAQLAYYRTKVKDGTWFAWKEIVNKDTTLSKSRIQ